MFRFVSITANKSIWRLTVVDFLLDFRLFLAIVIVKKLRMYLSTEFLVVAFWGKSVVLLTFIPIIFSRKVFSNSNEPEWRSSKKLVRCERRTVPQICLSGKWNNSLQQGQQTFQSLYKDPLGLPSAYTKRKLRKWKIRMNSPEQTVQFAGI